MAAIDPVAWLRSVPPFHALAQKTFDEASRALEISFQPAGTRLVEVGGRPLAHLWVIRKGQVRLERQGKTLQVLEEGETFGYTSLLTGEATLDVVVTEDLLAYRIPAEEFRRLLSDAAFAGHFAVGLSERLKASLEHSEVATFRADLTAPVEHLVRREAVWVGEEATVGDAARVMREKRISSVLVRGDPPGIVTDRDFRNRVLSERLGPDLPVTRILSRPLRTVAAATPIYEAWRELLDARVHHLPVVRDGAIVGIVTSSDLLRHGVQGPVAVLRRVQQIASREALPGYGAQVTEMAASLLAGGLDATVVAGFVARLNDALLHRILAFAAEQRPPPPAPWAWIAFGSEGRMEQTLLTDQDNALVYADEGEGGRAWYREFAERVNADLVAAGFPECPGGFMARKWHGPLSEWTARFRGWIDVPNPKALLDASIFFDFRRVGGDLDLAPLDAEIARAAGRHDFLRLMAQDAMRFHPPQSLLLRLRGESGTVDLKAQGISPIVFLARTFALSLGSRARNSLERLDAAAAAGLLGPDERSNLQEAFRFLVGLRLRLQLRNLAEGRPATTKAQLQAFTAVERTRIKESFRAIRSWQQAAAAHFQVDF